MKCIFCFKPTSKNEPVEHITDESLVGHKVYIGINGQNRVISSDYLVLKNGEVCGKCNQNRLRELGLYLQRQMGFLKLFYNHIGTKHGKPVRVERHGMYAERRTDGVHITFNNENKSIINYHGRVVQPATDHLEAVRGKISPINQSEVNIVAEWPFRINKRFVRALYKISFELLCYYLGHTYVLDPKFNPIREYILKGKGDRIIFIYPKVSTLDEMYHITKLTSVPSYYEDWAVDFNMPCRFYIDLSPDNRYCKDFDVQVLSSAGCVKWSDKGGGQQMFS